MLNPWEKIPLSDYESHMKLASVLQLQTMNKMMKKQLNTYPVKTAMILGIAGGNGLEHLDRDRYSKVYGIDINKEYLKIAEKRYSHFSEILEFQNIDLTSEAYKLPHSELLIANLLLEYIGYRHFQTVAAAVQPRYISCIIQINIGESWVSDSPYIHVFDDLDIIHHQMEESSLIGAMKDIGYKTIGREENLLPNNKKLVQLDFSG